MPYRSNRELPPWVRRMPVGAQNIYRSAFNAAFNKYKDDGTAARVAITAVKNKYAKTNGQWTMKAGENVVVEPLYKGTSIIIECNGKDEQKTTIHAADFPHAKTAEIIASVCKIQWPDAAFRLHGTEVNGTVYIHDIEFSEPMMWIDRQRELSKLFPEKSTGCLTRVQPYIVSNENKLISNMYEQLSKDGVSGITIKNTMQLHVEPVALYDNTHTFDLKVIERKDIHGMHVYRFDVNGFNVWSNPCAILAQPGAIVQATCAKIVKNVDKLDLYSIDILGPGKSSEQSTFNNSTGYDNYEINFITNTVRSLDDPDQHHAIRNDITMNVDIKEGTYEAVLLSWTDVPDHKSANKHVCGIMVDNERLLCIDGSITTINNNIIDKKVIDTVTASNGKIIIPAKTFNQFIAGNLDFSNRQSAALKKIKHSKPSVMMVKNKHNQYQWSMYWHCYDDKKDHIDFIFEGNTGVYGFKIYNDIMSTMSSKCVQHDMNDGLEFTKNELRMDSNLELDNILLNADAYNLATDINLYLLQADDTIKPNGLSMPESTFKLIEHGTLQHGFKRADLTEYWLSCKNDCIAGRWLIKLLDKHVSLEGETVYQMYRPEKMQEWYIKTHDINNEELPAIWQADGIVKLINM